jgi:magnesium and cobalt transporter
MLPRAQIEFIDIDHEPRRILSQVVRAGHSRFPVIEGDRDEVIGILHAKDLLRFFAGDEDNLRGMLRPAVFLPESKRLDVLLRDFRRSRNHMAVVVDEYGSVAGLVTIEDVIEQIVGDIEDEFDSADDEGDIFALPDGSYRVNGDTAIERINEAFGLQLPEGDFDTIGGLVAHELGHVPKRGETFSLGGLQWTAQLTRGGAVRRFRVLRKA